MLSTAPALAGPSTSSRSTGSTTVSSGPLTLRATPNPFRLELVQAGRTVLRSSPGALAFAVGPAVRAQTPEASYGVFAEAKQWIPATSATSIGKNHLRVRTLDPTRTFDVTLRSTASGVIELDARLSNPVGVAGTSAAFQRDPKERFLGFGERSDNVDQDGKVVEGWNEEGPFSAGAARPATDPVMGESWQGPPPFGPASNYTMPWFVARSGYGFLLNSTWLNRFDLDHPDTWRVEHADPSDLQIRLYGGPAPADVMRRFTADQSVGRQPAPASWYFGPWYQPTGTQAFSNNLVSQWRKDDVPVTVAQTYTHYLPCAAQFGRKPQEQALTDMYHQWGYKVTTYVNSFVCQDHPQGAYQKGDTNGWFVKTALGTTYPIPYLGYRSSSSAVVDFRAPGAVPWWQGLIREAINNGYDGWMEDYGEYVPPDAVLADGTSGVEGHNAYCTDYHRASNDLTSTQLHKQAFAQFVRCGYLGTAPYARIVWGGDPTEDDSEADGLAGAVNAGLSMGLSGIAYWGSDIGGFHALFTAGRTSPELLTRWLEFGAFSGIMRTEAEGYGRPDQTTPKAEVWDPDVLPYWREMTKLRTQLYPYIWQAANEYQSSGLPIMRHLALAYPNSPAAWGDGPDATAARFEFMFGPDLLVAPVVDTGGRARDVWLPPGQWVNFWDAFTFDKQSGEFRPNADGQHVVDGNRVVHVDAPLDTIPLFVRAGTCLPMLPGDVDSLITDTGFAHDADVVTLADRADAVRHIPVGAASC
jgi:alpha-glucosidase (family GH31 glycosyl hydrolase)